MIKVDRLLDSLGKAIAKIQLSVYLRELNDSRCTTLKHTVVVNLTMFLMAFRPRIRGTLERTQVDSQ